MTLLYLDSFKHQNSGRYTGGTITWNAPAGRTSDGYSINVATTTARRNITASAEIFMGAGYNFFGSARNIFSVWGDGNTTRHLTLSSTAEGALQLRLGNEAGTVIATSAAGLLSLGYTYVEMRVIVADSGGVCQVRLNGGTTNVINFSGDTKNGGTSTNIDAVGLSGSAGTSTFADFYVCNSSGSVNNTWLGDIRVIGLSPTGNGNSSQLVGSDGNSVNNFQQVDEVPYAAADYNGSPTSGDKDTYAFGDVSQTGTVLGVQVGAYWLKSDAGAKSAKIVTRSGSTDFAPNTTVLNTTATETLEIAESDPNTSAAWTVSNVNAAEFGMQVA